MSEPIVPIGAFDADAMVRAEPGLPPAFAWRDQRLRIDMLVRTWKSTKVDRGDAYVKRHYFEVKLSDGRLATIYFDRGAKRSAPRWFLYTIADPFDASGPSLVD